MVPKPLRVGKVKEVFATDKPDELEFAFTDKISVFDKIIPTLISHKGETLCRTSAHWFGVAGRAGFRTHFLGLRYGSSGDMAPQSHGIPGPARMRVKRVEVTPEPARLRPPAENILIPLEVVTRYHVAGSLNDRLKAGEVSPDELGFPKGRKADYGAELPEPFFEVTTKLEKVDRKLSEKEALAVSGLTKREFAALREATLKIDAELNRQVRARGLIHVDGKKEFAFGPGRELMLVDTFGTADEDRFWDAKEYAEGRFTEKSKEFVRQFYRNSGYHAALEDARKRGLPEPPIPALPPEFAGEVSRLYIALFEQLTGERFR